MKEKSAVWHLDILMKDKAIISYTKILDHQFFWLAGFSGNSDYQKNKIIDVLQKEIPPPSLS